MFPYIAKLGIIIPTDELIFFRGVVIPPTRNGTPQLNSRLGVYYNPGYSYYRTYYISGHILFNVLISPYSWQSKTFGPGFRRPEVKQEDPRRFTNIQVYIYIDIYVCIYIIIHIDMYVCCMSLVLSSTKPFLLYGPMGGETDPILIHLSPSPRGDERHIHNE